jgi:hypothetical protein
MFRFTVDGGNFWDEQITDILNTISVSMPACTNCEETKLCLKKLSFNSTPGHRLRPASVLAGRS